MITSDSGSESQGQNVAAEILIGRNLHKSWPIPGGRLEVLRGINISVKPGETLSITGPSGSGKSTLLGILGTLDRPTSGELIIENIETSRFSDHELARWRGRSLGIVFQQFHLMPSLTALENVSLPLEIAGDRNARSKALEAIQEVMLLERKNHLPDELSGGERQRVAIARALVTRPKLLLADEPSGSLDPNTGQHVSDLLFDLVKRHQMAMVLVTHNLDLAARCARMVKMSDGKLLTV